MGLVAHPDQGLLLASGDDLQVRFGAAGVETRLNVLDVLHVDERAVLAAGVMVREGSTCGGATRSAVNSRVLRTASWFWPCGVGQFPSPSCRRPGRSRQRAKN
jgi:hypothetical protein